MEKREFVKTGIYLGYSEALDSTIPFGDIELCPLPWLQCDIQLDNNIYPCCPAYCNNFSFGNLQEQSFEEIWNGEKANIFRNKMLSGDYPLCDLKTCAYKIRFPLNEIYNFYDDNGKVKYPQKIMLSNDFNCNAACIICRDNIKNNNKDEILLKIKETQTKLYPIFKKIKTLDLLGSGDPFSSLYSRTIIKETALINPDLNYDIITNGILMTEKRCIDLGILGRIRNVTISIHAATEDTYNKIVKFGNFNKVLQNIEWISNDMTISGKIFKFVVNNINYKEIPEFINFAKKYNFSITFTHYRYWGTEYGKIYNETAVWLPEHPEHNEFLKIMNTNIVKNNKYYYNFDGTLSQFIKD